MTTVDGQGLFAVLLYTDADQQLSDFVRTHIREIHELSGLDCHFFVIEEPQDEWMIGLSSIIGELSKTYANVMEERLGSNMYKPFDKLKAYEIARNFELESNQLPCIIFFKGLDNKETLVVELKSFMDIKDTDGYIDFFRCLFSYVQTATRKSYGQLDVLTKLLNSDRRRRNKSDSMVLEKTSLGVTVIEIVVGLLSLILPSKP